ncbi:hypothetical protein, partial [Thalassobius sp. I31.1]|uniref:hypothetical protein n=1 Tax=Thalassobius sp. I31.1 TaxID=2109912 RepID=UPI0018E592DA
MNQVVRKFEVIEGGCLEMAECATKQPTKQPLSNDEMWLDTVTLASLSGVSRQACSKSLKSRRWRGADLEVREVASNVGRGGKILQVHVDSLPADLRKTWYLELGVDLHEQVDTATGQMVLVPGEGMTRDARHEKALATAKWRLDLIRPALVFPKNSKDRRAKLDEAVATPRTLPNGKVKKLTRRTLENWVKDYETDSAGLAGLMPKGRSDKGTTRGTVTLAWDTFFMPHVAPTVPGQVRTELEAYIKELWASGAPGGRIIGQLSTTKLIELSHDLYIPAFEKLERGRLGDACGADTQFGICTVSRNQVEPFREYQKIAIKRKDNAVWQDKFMPSLRRDYSDYRPNDIVVGDVHPVDIVMKRPDGTKVYPKAISWLDVATNRIYMTFMLCEQREGVRREYVAQSFVALVEAWG